MSSEEVSMRTRLGVMSGLTFIVTLSSIALTQNAVHYPQCCVCGSNGVYKKIDKTAECPKECADIQSKWEQGRLEACPAQIPLASRRVGTSDNSFAYTVGGADFS